VCDVSDKMAATRYSKQIGPNHIQFNDPMRTSPLRRHKAIAHCVVMLFIYIRVLTEDVRDTFYIGLYFEVSKAVPLHAMEALVGRGEIAPTHSRPRH
jgi:hypothetical protein